MGTDKSSLTRLAENQFLATSYEQMGVRVLWWDSQGRIGGGDPLSIEYHSQLMPCIGRFVFDVVSDQLWHESLQILSGKMVVIEHTDREAKNYYRLAPLMSNNEIIGVLYTRKDEVSDEVQVSRQALERAVEIFSHYVATSLVTMRSGFSVISKLLPSFLDNKNNSSEEALSKRQLRYVERLPKEIEALTAQNEFVLFQLRLLTTYLNDYRGEPERALQISELVELTLSRLMVLDMRDIIELTVHEDSIVRCNEHLVVHCFHMIINFAYYYFPMTKKKMAISCEKSGGFAIVTFKFLVPGLSADECFSLVSEPLHLAYAHITGAPYELIKRVFSYHRGSVSVGVGDESYVSYVCKMPLCESNEEVV